MTNRKETLQDAADVLEDLSAQELEADEPGHLIDPRSMRTIQSGLEDIIQQLPEE